MVYVAWKHQFAKEFSKRNEHGLPTKENMENAIRALEESAERNYDHAMQLGYDAAELRKHADELQKQVDGLREKAKTMQEQSEHWYKLYEDQKAVAEIFKA